MKLAGTTALLTGATGGLGQAIARALANAGSTLLLSGRRTELLESLATELSARTLVADLAERADVARLVEQAGDIDVLIANAALPASGDLLDYTPDQIDRALEVNLRAPIFMARELVPRMIERRRGHLDIMPATLSGKAASPGTSIYSATKFGLRGFADGLRQDLYGSGVGVSVIMPGFVQAALVCLPNRAPSCPRVFGQYRPKKSLSGWSELSRRTPARWSLLPSRCDSVPRSGALLPAQLLPSEDLMGATRLSQQLAEGQRKKR